MTTIQEMSKLKLHTKEWFDAAFEGVPASEEIKEASKRICHSYSISGQSDPGYIANVIVACLANANTKKFEGIKYPI
uniref:Uncharacterized protein n=1 Tax=viral metagenome TaxID=1070528 RepID=A0A6M3MFH0_9ZZZZ